MKELVSDQYGALFTVGDAQSLAEKMKLVVENPRDHSRVEGASATGENDTRECH